MAIRRGHSPVSVPEPEDMTLRAVKKSSVQVGAGFNPYIFSSGGGVVLAVMWKNMGSLRYCLLY
jgi:hypothetical protein